MADEVFAVSEKHNLAFQHRVQVQKAIDDAQKRLDAQTAEIHRLKKEAADVFVCFDVRRDELQDKLHRAKADAAESERLAREEAACLEQIRAELAKACEDERAAIDKAKAASAKVANLQVTYSKLQNGMSDIVTKSGQLVPQLLGVQSINEASRLLQENHVSDMSDLVVARGQQKQSYHPESNLPEESLTGTWNANAGDWQEEVYQKIRTMKDLYFPELEEIYQRIAAKLLELDSLPHQPKTEQLEKLKLFKTMLERVITYLQVSKNNITSHYKEKLGAYEKQIISFLNTNRPRKPVPSVQQGQFLPVTSAFGAGVAAEGTTSKCSATTN